MTTAVAIDKRFIRALTLAGALASRFVPTTFHTCFVDLRSSPKAISLVLTSAAAPAATQSSDRVPTRSQCIIAIT